MQNNFKKTPLFLSIIFFIFFLFVFLFLYREIKSNNQKADLSIIELNNEASRSEDIRALSLSIETIKKERDLLETHFAKSSDIVPFLDTIESLAPQAGVKAEVASVDISKDSPGLVVQINASGSFESLYKFLTLLENSPYELEFITMDMKKEVVQAVQAAQAVPLKDVKVQELKWHAIFGIKLLSFVQ